MGGALVLRKDRKAEEKASRSSTRRNLRAKAESKGALPLRADDHHYRGAFLKKRNSSFTLRGGTEDDSLGRTGVGGHTSKQWGEPAAVITPVALLFALVTRGQQPQRHSSSTRMLTLGRHERKPLVMTRV